MPFVDAFYGPTHDRARSRDARRSSLQHLLRGAVRPVRGTGQTGPRDWSDRSPCRTAAILRTLAREGPRRGKRV